MNGDGGTSYIGSKRSIADLSFIYGGDNIGDGLVVIVPAKSHPACGCDYRCVVLDEFSVNVRCICPDGWRLKKDNQTACERKRLKFIDVDSVTIANFMHNRFFFFLYYFTAIIPQEIPMEHLIIFFVVVTILLIAALAALIFILCKCSNSNQF